MISGEAIPPPMYIFPPVSPQIWFIVSVVRYLKAPKSDKELWKKRQLLLIISAVAYLVTLLSLKIQTELLKKSFSGKIITPNEILYVYLYNYPTQMMEMMVYALIFSILAASLIWLIVSVIRYLTAPKCDKELRKKRRLPLIISAIVFAVLLFATFAIIILFTMAPSHM